MLAAPLMAGNDPRRMDEQTRSTLTNKEVIAVDQDPLGIEGFKYAVRDSIQIWFKPLSNDSWAVAFVNRGNSKTVVNFDWNAQVINDTLSKRTFDAKNIKYKLRNLWTNKESGNTSKPLNAELQPHDVLMFRLSQ